MALEDPACFQAVSELTRRLVLDYDWDGVDFAELYFEGMPGIFKHPKDFTPMHPTFRQMFAQRYGVDPRKMFQRGSPSYGPRNPQLASELQDFRIDLITQLTQKFLEILSGCEAQKPYLQTTLTFIDALRDPTVTERYGVDPARLLALQNNLASASRSRIPIRCGTPARTATRPLGNTTGRGSNRARLFPWTSMSWTEFRREPRSIGRADWSFTNCSPMSPRM